MATFGPYTLDRELVPFYEPMWSLVFWSATRVDPGGTCACTLALPRYNMPSLPDFPGFVRAFEADVEHASRFDHPVVLQVRARGRVEHVPFAELEPFDGITIGELCDGKKHFGPGPRQGTSYKGAMIDAIDPVEQLRAQAHLSEPRRVPMLAAVEIVRQLAAVTAQAWARTEGGGATQRCPALQTGTVLCARDGAVRLLPPFYETWKREMPSFDLPPWTYELGLSPPDPTPDASSYVFLLGTILYTLATGTRWHLVTRLLEMEQILFDFPLPSSVAAGLGVLDDVVRASTVVDPTHRNGDLDGLADALTPLLEQLAAKEPPADATRPTPDAQTRARAQIAQRVAACCA